MATAVSAMRLENPHSLSYQESTRTRRPSTICVCVRSKVDELGLWLKSIETSGSLLAPWNDLEVDDRNVGYRHANGRAVELAAEFGEHQSDGRRRPRRGRDDVDGGCPRAAHVLVRLV